MCSLGILKWVDCTVSDPSFFKLMTDSTPVHLALLDEVKQINDFCRRCASTSL